jgi:filamentous hemagglutinin family protein
MKLNLSGTTLIQQLILQIIIGLIVAANTGIVKAQLTPDNTVGSTTRSDTVNGLTSDIIEGGATRGTNLFHSFTNFNVDAGRGVYFSNPADINNILTRVTGSSRSNIFGTLGVLGNANLFLINPNGISFGPNAQLDVKGSFVASTADRIIFDNYQFTTTNPTAPPLLTVNIPVGLGFRNNPGDITVKDSNLSGSGLGVPQDKILWLNAGSGKVIFDNGGILSRGSQVILEGGDVSLTNNAFIDVSASGGGSITINSDDLTMENSRLIAGIDALSGSANAQAGDIKINNSRLFTLHNSSVSNNVGFLGTGYAGQINIKAYEINISGGALIESTVLSGGTGYAGDIRIETSNLIVDGGFISTDAYNDNSNTFGIAGNIDIYSSNDVTVKNGGLISSDVFSDSGQNDGGLIFIQTNTLNLENGGVISTSTYGQGYAGDIKINATDSINISGYAKDENNKPIFYSSSPLIDDQGNVIYSENKLASSRIESEVKTFATGNGGFIDINTSNLNLKDGGVISTSTYGQGSAGYIDINATDGINISGYAKGENNKPISDSNVIYDNQGNAYQENKLASSRIESEVKRGATRDGGYIAINTSNLNLKDGGVISTSTYGQGSAGFIQINETDSINISGYAKGENNEPISDSNVIYDNQGNVIYSENKLASSSSRIESNVESGAEGNAGNIKIDLNAGSLSLTNGGLINASTFGKGNAGAIDITAKDSVKADVKIDGSSGIASNVNPGAKGDAGNIKIDLNAGSLSLTNGGSITSLFYGETRRDDTSVKPGERKGGKITIKAGDINIKGRYSDNNSSFSSQINTGTLGIGDAGDIDITASNITIDDQGFFGSSVYNDGEGKGGNIKIETSNLTLKNGGEINTDTRANGDAGNIKLDITDNLKLTNSTISSGATSDSTGKAGNINIDPTLIELDGSQITVNSQGSGDGGNITLIGKNLNLNNSTISASTKSGQGGNITLNIPDTIRQNNSKIEASAGENGNGGNVTIKTKFIIGNGGNISANATQGRGGKIDIEAKGSFGYNGYRKDEPKKPKIDASSETGVNGVVEIYSGGEDPSQGLIDLPENLLTATIITNSCRQGQSSQNSNSLIVKGRGGLALTSDQLPSSSEVEVSLIAPTSVKSSSAINSTSANMEKTAFKTIIPAQGWEINSQGDVVLVGHSTGNPAERVNTAITCASN